MIEIIPSVLVNTEQAFLDQSRAVENCVSMMQLDIADGIFVPHTTWADPEVVEKELAIDCELHLMVAQPLIEARRWMHVPQVKRVLVHYESSPDTIADVCAHIHSYGREVGVVLNPDTPQSVIEPILEEIDTVMFMGVHPGKQGQKLIPEVLEKIKAVRFLHPAASLSIDGGVNEDTLPDIIAVGISAVCPGSAIFHNDRPPEENIARMRAIIHRLTDKN